MEHECLIWVSNTLCALPSPDGMPRNYTGYVVPFPGESSEPQRWLYLPFDGASNDALTKKDWQGRPPRKVPNKEALVDESWA